jgi:hypothetical protein
MTPNSLAKVAAQEQPIFFKVFTLAGKFFDGGQ